MAHYTQNLFKVGRIIFNEDEGSWTLCAVYEGRGQSLIMSVFLWVQLVFGKIPVWAKNNSQLCFSDPLIDGWRKRLKTFGGGFGRSRLPIFATSQNKQVYQD